MNFRESAKRRTSGSPVLEGRTKIDTDSLIARYPNEITITDFDFLSGENEPYVVCTFAEDPGAYFNGGRILTEIFAGFVDGYDGDLAKTQAEFREQGLKVRLYHGRTKKGNKVTLVEVL